MFQQQTITAEQLLQLQQQFKTVHYYNNHALFHIPLVLPEKYKKSPFFSYTKRVQQFVQEASLHQLQAHIINEYGQRFTPSTTNQDVINSFYDITYRDTYVLGKLNIPVQVIHPSLILSCLEKLIEKNNSTRVFGLRESSSALVIHTHSLDNTALFGYCNGVSVPKIVSPKNDYVDDMCKHFF